MNTIKQTIQFIKEAHKGQVDKSGKDYYLHCIGVYHILSNSDLEEIQHAALLHDVIEDTCYTADRLLDMGYSKEVVDIVSLVSRDKTAGLTYQEWIKSIADLGNIGAIKVKIADLKHNSSVDRMAALDKDVSEGMLKRYNKALGVLESKLKELV